ncbi:MAG: formate dehydrogenase accessory sulfurtransferase FdhD [Bacillota bacterium]|nr:formate dehydrogenase accessory sulfurtransferase FdhD [Bacillota bacterium]
MTSSPYFKNTHMTVYKNSAFQPAYDPVVCEEALCIIVGEYELCSLIFSPSAEKELAIGFLISEGLLDENNKVISLKHIAEEDKNKIIISTFNPIPQDKLSKKTIMQKASDKCANLKDNYTHFSARDILDRIHELDKSSYTFRMTGGVHSAALGNCEKTIVRYEDIGRHNAVDKVFGYAYLNQVTLHDKALILSGRVASEIVLKAAFNAIPFIISRSAPTLKAIELATEFGITIIGFARESRFNVYTHPHRVML